MVYGLQWQWQNGRGSKMITFNILTTAYEWYDKFFFLDLFSVTIEIESKADFFGSLFFIQFNNGDIGMKSWDFLYLRGLYDWYKVSVDMEEADWDIYND